MMVKKLHQVIYDVEELSKKLKPRFVLLVGSAVSGANTPELPMVHEVLEGIIERVANRLNEGSYSDRILAKYAFSLIKGRYARILKTTKFEEFLWRIEKVMDRLGRDDLLAKLYVCDKNEFGPNHSAITTLLKHGKCTACLTTNFDNALERSEENLDVRCHPEHPEELSDLNQPPILLKLHGDASKKNCVATSPVLYEARQLEEHRYLRELLAGKTVFVVGYSGFGDVDISPHLAYAARERKTNFIWGVRNAKKRAPDFAKYKAVLDLGSLDTNKNMLLNLAARCGWQANGSSKAHQWKDELNEWCDSYDDRKLKELLTSILEGQVGWHTLHIFHCFSDTTDADLSPLNHGIACLKVAAYVSAEKSFKKALSSIKSWNRKRIETLMYLGFTQWRYGNLENAIQILQELVDLEIESFSEEDQPAIANGSRVYLEVCRDWMQYMRHVRDRKCFYDGISLNQVIDRLKNLPKKVDVGDRILTHIAIADVRRLISEKVELSEVRGIYDESINYKYWEIAEAAARVMVNLWFREGLVALLKVGYEHAKRRTWNKIRKCIAVILHSLLRGRFPIILSLLDGPILASLKTPVIEWDYRRKRRKWEKQKLQGKIKIV